jgi:hypothetical protein
MWRLDFLISKLPDKCPIKVAAKGQQNFTVTKLPNAQTFSVTSLGSIAKVSANRLFLFSTILSKHFKWRVPACYRNAITTCT